MPNECELIKHPEHARCCCVCRFQVKDYNNITWTQRGLACVGLLFTDRVPIISSGMPAHGLCEMFERKKVADA